MGTRHVYSYTGVLSPLMPYSSAPYSPIPEAAWKDIYKVNHKRVDLSLGEFTMLLGLLDKEFVRTQGTMSAHREDIWQLHERLNHHRTDVVTKMLAVLEKWDAQRN